MGQQIQYALQQSLNRVLYLLGTFLPGFVAALLVMIVFVLIGWLLALIARKLLTGMRFDERLSSRKSTGILNVSDWSPNSSPTLLIARALWWVCFIAGIALAISAFNAVFIDNGGAISLFFLPYLTHIVGATLLLIGGTLLARFLARSVLIGAVNAQLQYARFLSLGIKWLVLVLTAAMALDHLRIGGNIIELAFGILFGGIVLTLALAIGLGSRDLVSRSIERTIDKPALDPAVPTTEQNQPPLRHF